MHLLLVLVLGLAATVPCTAESFDYTGPLVDIYCWNLPDHIGIDGAKLDTAPQDHTVHCLRDIQQCIDSGYAILQKDVTTGKYSVKFRLDAAGNAKVAEIFKTTTSVKAFRVTASGTSAAGSDSLAVTSMVEASPSTPDGCSQATMAACSSTGCTGASCSDNQPTLSDASTLARTSLALAGLICATTALLL
mmetsp:Transcript_23764/g.55337  ORF Transcript_23764/g.55337 Transcript_23764/m.55337 type:complete len:191 (-) Transcript_23764:60-632(-)